MVCIILALVDHPRSLLLEMGSDLALWGGNSTSPRYALAWSCDVSPLHECVCRYQFAACHGGPGGGGDLPHRVQVFAHVLLKITLLSVVASKSLIRFWPCPARCLRIVIILQVLLVLEDLLPAILNILNLPEQLIIIFGYRPW